MISRWRWRYWTCSRFADWLRGTRKPPSATAEGWDEWHRKAKKAHPFRYWLADDGLDYIQNIVYFPLDVWRSIRAYLLNRFVYELHLLRASPTNIKPGSYCDFGDRLLPCIFDSFTRWVEREVGLDHLEWETKLVYDDKNYGFSEDDPRWGKPTPQAERAREVLLLHWWWTVERQRREDANAKSTVFWDQMTEKYSDDVIAIALTKKFTPEEYAEWQRLHAEADEIEERYAKEDTAMLQRLIAMRRELWS